MNAPLVRDAATILGVAPERVFGLAFEYWETPKSKKYIINQFKEWYFSGKIHPTVQDFVIDVLAKRVQPTRLLHEHSPKK